MENLYEYTKIGYRTIKYKEYCEISEEELLGNHISDTPNNPFFFVTNRHKSEFDYLSSHSDEETYKENLNNIFCNVIFQRLYTVVQKDENKISLRFYIYELQRENGKKYFKKTTILNYLTYSFKDNSLYCGRIQDYHKKKKCSKKLSKNIWFDKPIRGLSEKMTNYIRGFKGKDFDDLNESQLLVNQAFETFLSNISGIDNSVTNPDDRLYKKFLDSRGIKLPNNWISFNRTFPQMKVKDFKKNKLKFVDTFMNFHGLNGDKIKRVLHNIKRTTGLGTFKFTIEFFGSDFMLSQKDEIIKQIIESNEITDNRLLDRITTDGYTKNEIKNSFQIFLLTLTGEINSYSFFDHVKYKEKLKNFEPVIWKSNNYDKFIEEHYNWSEKVGSLSNAQYNRKYNTEFKDLIEQPINDYYPVILSTTKEYNMESFLQNNCVRTYTDKPSSFIISVRKGDTDNKERATIEYQLQNVGKTIVGSEVYEDYLVFNRVQSLGKFNKKLGEEWNEVLEILDEKIKLSLEKGIFKLPEVEIKYGNKTYMTDLIFADRKEYYFHPNQGTDFFMQKRLVFGNDNLPKRSHTPNLNIVPDDLFF